VARSAVDNPIKLGGKTLKSLPRWVTTVWRLAFDIAVGSCRRTPTTRIVANLLIQGLRKSFGDVPVLRGIDLEIEVGEFIVFVGPSGCGKSTLLRCIAGLEDIPAGELRISGERVNDVPPSKRGIAMVFQNYACTRTCR
jgi:ABC-type multidrug transport system fused ATPase/permease subunit